MKKIWGEQEKGTEPFTVLNSEKTGQGLIMKVLETICFAFGATVFPLNLAIYLALTHHPIQLYLVGVGFAALAWSVLRKVRRGSFV